MSLISQRELHSGENRTVFISLGLTLEMKRNSFFVPHRSLPWNRFSAVACKSSFWLALGVTALAGAAGLNGAEV